MLDLNEIKTENYIRKKIKKLKGEKQILFKNCNNF